MDGLQDIGDGHFDLRLGNGHDSVNLTFLSGVVSVGNGADTIKIAKDEFRFYADATALAPTMSFQAYAPKPKTKTPTSSSAVRRTPTGANAVASRLAHQDRLRGGTPYTPIPSSAAVSRAKGGTGFGWMWAVVLLALGFAAYYMLSK